MRPQMRRCLDVRLAWLVAAVIGAFAPLPVAGRDAHRTVAVPRRDQGRDEIAAIRTRLAARRAEWPDFLHDPRRNGAFQRDGLLTRAGKPAARRAAHAALRAPNVRGRTSLQGVLEPDTVRVLVARIGFAANRAPHLTSMDPSGDFRLTPDSTVIVDPPPHDVPYWDAQIVALAAYYDRMSHGQLVVQGTAFPPSGEPSIKLSDMADYGPGESGNWTLPIFIKYFQDAVGALDSAATGRIDLRDYDVFTFAHPGSDLQNDINLDSPNDLPTFFISVSDSLAVPVQAGQDTIASGLVLPEQLSQDGLTGGLLGTFCHEFGHGLGLPDWYDTYQGLPVVGEWDLMDSGNQIFFAFQVEGSEEVQVAYGLLPSGMSVIDRYLLGWEDPERLQPPQAEVTLRPANTVQGDGPRSARLDVSADEYFLVENRRDLLYEHPEDVEPCPYLNRDSQTGVVLWTSRDDANKPSRERRNSGDYDFFITIGPDAPASAFGDCGEIGFGLLVWHVDERIIADGYGFNEVNIDPRRRSLRILEASGDFEIGDIRQISYGFLGDGWNDPFREGYATELRSDTRPNNWNNDWAATGWEITDIRTAAPESHTLSVQVTDGVAGWPRVLRVFADSLPPVDPQSAVHGTFAGLGPALAVADTVGVWGFGAGAPRALHRGAVGLLAYTPQLVGTDPNGTLAGTDGTRLWFWDALLAGDSLQVRAGFPVSIPGGTLDRLVLLDAASGQPGALVELADGSWAHVDALGNLGSSIDVAAGREVAAIVGQFGGGAQASLALVGARDIVFGPLVPGGPGPAVRIAHGLDAADSLLFAAGGAIDPNQTGGQVVVLHRDGRLRVVDPVAGVLSGFGDFPADTYVGLALADVNGDGRLDIVAASSTKIAVETHLGAFLLETPRALRDAFAVQSDPRIESEPLVADVAGDSLPELLVTTDVGLVYALAADGSVVPGYPRKMLADRAPAALLATDLDADGTADLLGVGPSDANAASPAGGSGMPGWTIAGGDAARTRWAVAGPRVAGAQRLQARERALLAWPNPARSGVVQLRITADRSGPFDVAIYNLEGQRVFQRTGTLQPGTQEIPWSVTGLAPGIYLCRFVSEAAGVSSPLLSPITVLR